MSPVSVMFGMLYLACIAFRPGMLPWMLAASLPFAYTSVITVGSIGLNPFWVGAIFALIRTVYLLEERRRQKDRNRIAWKGPVLLLAIFVSYGIYSTVTGPFLFAGMPVITPRGGLDSQIDNYSPLEFSATNISQLIYLFLGSCVVVYFMLEKSVSPRIFEIAIVVVLGLAVIRELVPQIWVREWFDNLPRIYYATYGGRQRGSFAEPSILGAFVTCSFAYSVSAFANSRGFRRAGYLAAILVGIYVFYISSTGTALVGLVVTGAIALTVGFSRAVGSGFRGMNHAAPTLGLCAILVFVFWDKIYGFAFDLYSEKLGTSSYANRNSSNEQALTVFFDSFGLGVGLGSNRPSSLGLMLLSCVGVVGTLAYFGMVSGFLVRAFSLPEFRPVCWALIAMMAAMITSKPDLSMPFAWLLIGVCAAGYTRIVRESECILEKPQIVRPEVDFNSTELRRSSHG